MRFSGKTVFEELAQAGLARGVGNGLFERYAGVPAVELERRDVVREPRFAVGQVPAHLPSLDPCEPGEEEAGDLGRLRPGDVLQPGLLPWEGVAQRRADRLVDPALHPVAL